MKDDGSMEPGEALIEQEMHGHNEDCEWGNYSVQEAMWDSCKRLNMKKWDETSGKERMQLINEFMKNNENIHTDPSIISAKMVCTALHGVQRQLREIKHLLMGQSEDTNTDEESDEKVVDLFKQEDEEMTKNKTICKIWMAMIIGIFVVVFAGFQSGPIISLLSLGSVIIQIWMVCRLWKCEEPNVK